MNKKTKFYSDNVLVASVAAAALGVVLLNTTQDVKADQIVQPSVNKTSTKQTPNKIAPVANTNNNDITDNSLKQADNSDNEDKPNQSLAAKAPALPPKKAIKTVDDLVLPKTINWKDSYGKESKVTLTLNADDHGGYELDIGGGEITNPQTLQNVFSANDDYEKIHTINIKDQIKIITSAQGLFRSLSGLKQIDGLDKVNTSQVTNIRQMFAGCSALTSLDLSNFEISADINKIFLFKGCTNLNTLKLGKKCNLSGMVSLPGPRWYKVGNGTLTKPEDSNGHEGTWFNNFNGATDYGTYVRLKLEDGTSTIAGNITVQYLDKDNKEIKLPESSELSQPYEGLLGGTITPESEITDANGIKYRLVEKNPQAAIFTTDKQDIELHYQAEGGDITIHYVDKDGKEIKSSEVHQGLVDDKVGLESEITDANGQKYRLVEKNPQEPIFTIDKQDIKLHYQAEGGDITIHYVDKDGKEIKSSEVHQGLVDDKVGLESEITDANGQKYRLVEKNPQEPIFTIDKQDIKLHYQAEGGDITIHYVDKDGKEIKSSEVHQGLVDDKVALEPEITDAKGQKYLIAKDERNPKEVAFTPQTQNITLYYIKVPSAPNNANIPGGDVTVHYQDEAGHTLAPDEIIKGHLGAGYVSRTVQISGYSLKTRPEKATGFFTSDPQSITYVYTLDEAKISKRLMHNAFIYDQNHRRVGESKFHSYEKIMVYPKLVTLADGVQAYKLADNQYVLAANIDGTLRKLKHNAYVYQTVKKRANRLVLSKGKVIRTYGAPYQFKNGKLYYRIGGPKRQYVRVSNFK